MTEARVQDRARRPHHRPNHRPQCIFHPAIDRLRMWSVHLAMLASITTVCITTACTDPIQLGRADSEGTNRQETDGNSGATTTNPWHSMTVPDAEGIRWNAIHGDDQGRIWVAGSASAVATYADGAWTTYSAGVFDDFAAVYALSSKDVFVAGVGGLLFRFDGENWHNIHSETAELRNEYDDDATSYGSIASSGADSVYISSSASYRGAFPAILTGERDAEGNWTYRPLSTEGYGRAHSLNDRYAVGYDDLWYNIGSTFASMRKPREGTSNRFSDLWVANIGVFVLSDPNYNGDEILLLNGQRWLNIRVEDKKASIGRFAGDRDGERVFIGGQSGYLGEIVDDVLQTIEPTTNGRPSLGHLYVSPTTIWAVDGEEIWYRNLPPKPTP